MRRHVLAITLAGGLVAAWALPATAQENGIVIQNNGVDSSDSAAGADNVSISNNPGNAQSATAGGVNNENVETERVPRERDRKDRSARNADQGSGEAAPAEPAAAPAPENLQAYSEGGESVDPAAAPATAPQPAEGEPVTLQLPNTGTGSASPITAVIAGIAAITAGAASVRRRLQESIG